MNGDQKRDLRDTLLDLRLCQFVWTCTMKIICNIFILRLAHRTRFSNRGGQWFVKFSLNK